MAKDLNCDVLPNKDNKSANKWKGSVFNTSEWVPVGTTPARSATSHGRQITQWALKSWLAHNTLNGYNYNVSAFSFYKIYKDFKTNHGSEDPATWCWYIGREHLAAEFLKEDLVNPTLFGVKVKYVDGTGAVLVSYAKNG